MGLLVSELKGAAVDYSKPVPLFKEEGHEVYWVGSYEEYIFRCNAYLIVSGDKRVLLDPGGIQHFEQVKARVSQLIEPSEVTHIVAHHQDPDVIGSLPLWLKLNPNVTVVTTPRTQVLIPYYGFDRSKVNWLDVSPLDDTMLELEEGALVFLSAPFLHFPDAFVTYDSRSKILFTGDIFAAIQQRWELVVSDFEEHKNELTYFHVYYMASNKALRHFVEKVRPFPVDAIAPQHGSIIPKEFVGEALDFLEELKCGIDLLEEESPARALIGRILKNR
ncbi:beta-lactamase domain-containing protein [Thermovibrio ammonificans HB-1]|jgi:flavorubredoxin|uniref:Beta-lactamase domain-containing protein n=1 Tax=Thermovibrio ammonificans (strain DSM 15698 / JCM 12110 / HB-1) TaxID=648996 RepID=E8T5L9_THEA1|nr:MBL fold metallo-hydrolase [Thermovibrio ammonificans]ADU96494.1 beta-lactamase domain-containing protein [Thermovibrio ammonificans HB-1]